MKIKPLLGGLRSWIYQPSKSTANQGGSYFARYCYQVWLTHLNLARGKGLAAPAALAELGPGDSLGLGLAGLLSGAESYVALETVNHTNFRGNLRVFDELVELFKQRSPLPGFEEFPEVFPRLESREFPEALLGRDLQQTRLAQSRIQSLRAALTTPDRTSRADSAIRFICPWNHADHMEKNSVDFLFSQAVLEHVNDLEKTYAAFAQWVKPSGFMSHTIDFRCHGTASLWNGHWAYADLTWRLIEGKRPYLINRQPLSTHLNHMKNHGFKICSIIPKRQGGGIGPQRLAKRFKSLSIDDLETASAYVLAQKR